MTMSNEKPKAPPEKYSIEINEQKHDLFMSFGLMNTLAIPIKSVDDLIEIDNSPELREFILHSCLDTRNEEGLTITKFNLKQLSYAQGEEVLEWVRGHLTDFFITRLRNKLETQRRVNQTLIPS